MLLNKHLHLEFSVIIQMLVVAAVSLMLCLRFVFLLFSLFVSRYRSKLFFFFFSFFFFSLSRSPHSPFFLSLSLFPSLVDFPHNLFFSFFFFIFIYFFPFFSFFFLSLVSLSLVLSVTVWLSKRVYKIN